MAGIDHRGSISEIEEEMHDSWVPPLDLTAREVCALPLPEGQSVLGPICMVGGRLVIGGKSGEGKSALVMAMAKAVAHGDSFLDWEGCGGTVLVFDLEQGLRTVQKVLARNGLQDTENVRYYRIPDGLALETNETQSAWMLGLIIQYQPSMVVLDPLYKAHQGDSNDERAMVDMMRRLDKWRDLYGFCLVIPMHLRKLDPKSTDPTMDDIFGSGGLTRGAEVVLGLRKLAPGKSRLYFWKDRDGDLHEEDRWNLLFSHETGFERDPEDKGAPPAEVITRAFLQSGGGVMTKGAIKGVTALSDDKLRKALAEMEAEGALVQTGKGAHGAIKYRMAFAADAAVKRYEDIAGGEWDG